jgi:CRISPR-associated protein Cas1
MRDHIVEIESEGRHISVSRGFLVISKGFEELGKVPLDDIQALVVASQGASLTTKALIELAQRGVPTILSGEKYMPEALVWPVDGNHLTSRRIQKQLSALKPFKKRLWQTLIKLKLDAQASVLEWKGIAKEASILRKLEKKVLSGDKGGVEAWGAKIYWEALFGKNFSRDNKQIPINAFLNYGYAILRSSVARATSAAGLHPAVSVYHTNRFNPFCLVDDLMEPFRPIVDQTVIQKFSSESTLLPNHKKTLVNILRQDMSCAEGKSPLNVCIQKFITSIAISFEENKLNLRIPRSPLPINSSILC